MNGPDRHLGREAIYASLLYLPCSSRVGGDPNRALLANLLAGQAAGCGCLPADLGLGKAVFSHLLATYFPGNAFVGTARPLETIPEWEDLQKLLLEHRARRSPSELLIASIVASACCGRDHLWQDLGLRKRDELSVRDLMTAIDSIDTLYLNEVLNARVVDILEALKTLGRQHILVEDTDQATGLPRVRGLFSATHIGRLLGVPVLGFDLPRTFAEIEAALVN